MTLPGRKQVFRDSEAGRMRGDVIGRFDERRPGKPFLRQVMRNGKRTREGRVWLKDARVHARTQLDALPPSLHALERVETAYPVRTGPALNQEKERLQRVLEAQMESEGLLAAEQ